MRQLGREEEWARQILESNLNVPVRGNDDGSRDSMHDLEIHFGEGRLGAVEVTAAADGPSLAIWKHFNDAGGRWIEPELVGGWSVALAASARARVVRQDLPILLRALEHLGLSSLKVRPRSLRDPLTSEAAALGVSWARQYETGFPGSIYVEPDLPRDQTGGMVAETGDPLAEWLGDYLSSDRLRDVRGKLASALAQEKHAFVILPGFAEAPFVVIDLLMRPSAPLPTLPPELPPEITHVWATSTWVSGVGMRWSPDIGWQSFDKDPNPLLV